MLSRGRYRSVLARPGVLVVLLPYVLSRLSATMVLLSVLLYARHETGSFAVAGAVSAAFAGAAALTAPVLGRVIDRRGHWPVLAPCALTQPVALVALVLLLQHGLVGPALVAAAAAGALVPPVTSCMRALWPGLVDDEELMSTAWSVEGMVVEATELGGPLAAGLLLLLADPAAGVLVAAGLAYTGAMLFALTPTSQSWRSQRREERAGLIRTPLRVPGVRALVLVVFVATAGLAALEVAIAAFAQGRGQPGYTGPLFAVWLGASLVGGWFYGSRTWRFAPHRQLPVLLAGCGLTALAPLLAQGYLSMSLLLAVAGLAIAPATAVQFAVMSRVAHDQHRTEAFTWASTAGFLGVAAGSSLSGSAIQVYGGPAGMVLSAALGLAAALVAFASRRAFVDPAALPVASAQVPRQPRRDQERVPRRVHSAEHPLTG